MTIYPIYKDLKHIFSSSNSFVRYVIEDDRGHILYEGTAYRKPTEQNAFIYINRIVSNMDSISSAVFNVNMWTHTNAIFRIVVKEVTSSSPITSTYNFIYCWDDKRSSYDTFYNYDLNFQSSHNISERDLIPVSIYNGQEASSAAVRMIYHFPDGSTMTDEVDNATLYPNDINHVFVPAVKYKSALVKSDSVTITEDDSPIEYFKTLLCNRFSLYYRNRDGGIDIFPLGGNVVRNDSYDRKTIITDYDNNYTQAFAKRVINNNITTKYSVTTQFITDEEAHNLSKHLFASPEVMFYDNVDNVFYSALIDEKSVDYKSFKNQGRKLNRYSFTIEISQMKKIK